MTSTGQGQRGISKHSVASVDAPTALAAFQLRLRLPRSEAMTTRRGTHLWVVHVRVAGPGAIRRLLDSVRFWLIGEQIAETDVRVGEDLYHVSRKGPTTNTDIARASEAREALESDPVPAELAIPA